jgi:hypothetical protein
MLLSLIVPFAAVSTTVILCGLVSAFSLSSLQTYYSKQKPDLGGLTIRNVHCLRWESLPARPWSSQSQRWYGFVTL